jgi:hypothetical protein
LNKYVVAIVGGGPRSVYALERLLALLQKEPFPGTLSIHVFESHGRIGAGAAHSDEQPVCSYLNRCVDQIAFAADESVLATSVLLPLPLRMTFHQWCQQRFKQTGDERFNLAGNDVPHRYLHGVALRDHFNLYAALLNKLPGVEVIAQHDEVTGVRRHAAAFKLSFASGRECLQADHILFITGHTPCRPKRATEEARYIRNRRYIPYPYPLEQCFPLQKVGARSRIGLLGMGLTAIDVCLFLTEGRGGQFISGGDGGLHYLQSGDEPAQIVVLSPSGKMYSTRPVNAKVMPEHFHSAEFFSEVAIEQLRQNHGRRIILPDGSLQRQLDFRRDIFPLVVLEMALVYYRTLLGDRWSQRLIEVATPAYLTFLSPASHDGERDIHRLLQPVQRLFDQAVADFQAFDANNSDSDSAFIGQATAFYRTLTDQELAPKRILSALLSLQCRQVKWGHSIHLAAHRFDWLRIFEPFTDQPTRSVSQRRRQVLRWLERDLAAASQGNRLNPLKAACDGVWRDLRAVFSAVTDFGGLTPESQREFSTLWMSYYNRLSNGAGVEAMQKMAALIRQGRVVLAPAGMRISSARSQKGFILRGRGQRLKIEHLACARLHPFDARHQQRPLYPMMLREGLIQLWENRVPGGDSFVPGGLMLTAEFHPRTCDLSVETRLTFIGAPAEGVCFFQNAAARPGTNSAALNVAHAWAAQMLKTLREQAKQAQEVQWV